MRFDTPARGSQVLIANVIARADHRVSQPDFSPVAAPCLLRLVGTKYGREIDKREKRDARASGKYVQKFSCIFGANFFVLNKYKIWWQKP